MHKEFAEQVWVNFMILINEEVNRGCKKKEDIIVCSNFLGSVKKHKLIYNKAVRKTIEENTE
jgi:hypothetical protein